NRPTLCYHVLYFSLYLVDAKLDFHKVVIATVGTGIDAALDLMSSRVRVYPGYAIICILDAAILADVIVGECKPQP
ncbi:hypothetical protein H0H87_011521, partial [Tephrocybe sp. NHM501043]